MSRSTRYWLLMASVGLLVVGDLWGNDAEKVFESLYGQKLSEIEATKGTSDDLELAKQLIEAGKTSTDVPELLRLMCEKAYQLSLKEPEGGVDVAIDSMILLAGNDREYRADHLEKAITAAQKGLQKAKSSRKKSLSEKIITLMIDLAHDTEASGDFEGALAHYRRAAPIAASINSSRRDEIKGAIATASVKSELASKFKWLKERVSSDPRNSAAAKEFVEFCVVELDDPAAASDYLESLTDPVWKSNVRLALSPVDALTDAQCMTLGDWYRALSAEMSDNEAAMLSRSLTYYRRFIELHGTKDLEGKKAQLVTKEIETELAKLGVRPAPESQKEFVPRLATANITVTNSTATGEAARVINEAAARYPQVTKDIKQVELLRFYDASTMRRNSGGPMRMPGSFSQQPIAGTDAAIMLWGSSQDLKPGKYVVLYRLQALSALKGPSVAFLDVASNGVTVAGYRPSSDEFGQNRWVVIPVPVSLDAPRTVEFRFWPSGHPMAVDRIYVFAVTETQ